MRGASTNKELDMLISIDTGGRAEVMIAQTLETGWGVVCVALHAALKFLLIEGCASLGGGFCCC